MEGNILRKDDFDRSSKQTEPVNLNYSNKSKESSNQDSSSGYSREEEIGEELIKSRGSNSVGLSQTRVVSERLEVDRMFAERLRFQEKEIALFRIQYSHLRFPEIDALLKAYPAKRGE